MHRQMPRYRLTIEYDGTPYVGWQRQKNGPGVQAAIEKAIVGFAHEQITLQVAGRTDTGVHALAQIAHVDLSADWSAKTVRDAINALLTKAKEPVAITAVALVDEDFHARFSAKARHYRYLIENRPVPSALNAKRAWLVKRPLDCAAMNDAAQELLGLHDFTTFRAAQCQSKSPVKTMDRIYFERDGAMITVSISAKSFLHNQVRSIVGTLKMVGDSRWSRADVARIRDAREHQLCGALAPAHGLYLEKVDY